jgi:thioredoxin-like negative regulator of GroEL
MNLRPEVYRRLQKLSMLMHGNLERAVALRPTHPTYLYKLAGAYSLAGRKDAALKTLGRVAAMRLVYSAAKLRAPVILRLKL